MRYFHDAGIGGLLTRSSGRGPAQGAGTPTRPSPCFLSRRPSGRRAAHPGRCTLVTPRLSYLTADARPKFACAHWENPLYPVSLVGGAVPKLTSLARARLGRAPTCMKPPSGGRRSRTMRCRVARERERERGVSLHRDLALARSRTWCLKSGRSGQPDAGRVAARWSDELEELGDAGRLRVCRSSDTRREI